MNRRAHLLANTADHDGEHRIGRLRPAVFPISIQGVNQNAPRDKLAARLPVEIVSVDSAQVYREMNIGTAKPNNEILAAAPHHLINLISPDEAYSAARFRDDALTLMREITERGNIPLLVGGTMMYFKALTEGLSELPEADPLIRMIIDTMAEEKGWPGVHRELARVDPEIAAKLAPSGNDMVGSTPEAFRKAVVDEIERWRTLLKEAGVAPIPL